MRLLNGKAVSMVALAAAGVACTPPPPAIPTVDLAITKITPDKVFNEGGTQVTVDTTNGCEAPKGKVEGNPVALTKVAADKYKFTAPAASNLTGPVSTKFEMDCSAADQSPLAPTTAGAKYGKATAEIGFSYDPGLEPAPEIKSYGPSGEHISVLAHLTVTFTRAMDKASVEKAGNIGIQGVNGATTYDASTKTATFVPEKQLDYQKADGTGGQYTAFVKADVHSASGKALHTTLNASGGTPAPEQDTWKFTTRKEGEGNPWVGDISAAAGMSTGGGYKLFSVTGQPTPVGEAYAGTAAQHTYKVQSGFIYATQTGNGQ